MIHVELNSNGSASYLNIRNFTFFSEIYNKKTLAGKKYKDDIDFIHFDFFHFIFSFWLFVCFDFYNLFKL